jgi:N-methylhydantoinase A
MGGTTASASLIHKGELSRANEYEFRAGISTPSRFIKAGGYLMRVPTVDVAEVGSGAGSISRVDEGGLLHVGPISAGADPGPVCYGIGGRLPTVTDANVVLGFLPAALAGGSMKLDVAGARNAIKRDLADPLKLSIEDAAFGVREVVNINMARTIKAVTVERGVDPRDFALLAFGGSGPVHACDLARTLGIKRVVFPQSPGVFTATGMLAAQVERYFLRAVNGRLDQMPIDEVNTLVKEMRAEASASLANEGYAAERVECNFEADLRFAGQDFEIPVPMPESVTEADRQTLRDAFRAAYKGIYGYASSDAVEIVNIRLNASGKSENVFSFQAVANPATGGEPITTRPVYVSREKGWVETPIYERATVKGGLMGPLIIESPDTTVVIPLGASVDVDTFGNVVATIA